MISGSSLSETAYGADLEEISSLDSVRQEDNDIPSLILKLQQGTSYEKQRAAISLGASRSKSAVEPLIAALNDPDLFVQNFAARALGNIGDVRAVEPLVKALKNGDILVQRSAANALGDLKSPEVVEPLIQALEGGNYLVQRAAAESLGKTGDSRAIDPLIRALESRDIYVQSGAATALKNIGAPAVPKLISLISDWSTGPLIVGILKDSGWEPSSDQENVWFDIASRNAQSLVKNWEMVRKILINEANSEHSERAYNAILALIGLGHDDVIGDLVEILDKKGNREIATAFLNCGNDALQKAARSWIGNQKEDINTMEGVPPVEWGELQSG